MDFLQQAKAKFEKGALEHKDQGWENMENSLVAKEAMEELLDLYNYMNHPSIRDQYFAQSLRLICVKYYRDLSIFYDATTGKSVS